MNGALKELIQSHSQYYSEEFCKYSLYKTARALQHMHSKQILHRDIKSANILFNSKGEIKICDLGLAVALIQEKNWRTTQKGTMNWMAPEIVDGVQYSKTVDVWSFGIYAYELATGFPPFAKCGRDRNMLLDHIRNKEVD